ncbi:MAG: hydrogenase nickel incorporation protein HypB [Methylocella sp.]
MCATCGCESEKKATILNLQTGAETTVVYDSEPHRHVEGHIHADHLHDHSHARPHGPASEDAGVGHNAGPGHQHAHDDHHEHAHRHEDHQHDNHFKPSPGATVELDMRILAKNDALAAKNRAWFAGREILALNLVSSPGAGKTTLLERTIRDLRQELRLFVVEGDQATSNDGERILAAGAPVIQVNTGAGCHLDADMVARGLAQLRPETGSVVMIENVGNLICPALFDLGERAKIVVLSVTEGEDKPLKYPHIFRAANLVILNKRDLLPHLDFDVARVIANVREVNPDIIVLKVSARSGEGLDAWYDWIRQEASRMRDAAFT